MQFVPAEFNPKNVHMTVLKGNLGYDQYTEAFEDNFLLIALASMASRAILSNFFEKQ